MRTGSWTGPPRGGKGSKGRTCQLVPRGRPSTVRQRPSPRGAPPCCWRTVYRQVFEVPWILHFEPSLEALSLGFDVIDPIKLSLGGKCS